MSDNTRHIRERFPEKSHIIELLTDKYPEFLTLCEDYDACVDAMAYWTNSKAPEAKIRVEEYRTFVEELEEEITQFLVAL
jgi:hypothetical protein